MLLMATFIPLAGWFDRRDYSQSLSTLLVQVLGNWLRSHAVVLEAVKGFHEFLDVTGDIVDDDPEAEVQEELHELRDALTESLATNAQLLKMLGQRRVSELIEAPLH